MTRPGRPPSFKVALPPKAVSAQSIADVQRGSPRERGIDSRMDRMNQQFRKQNPFCRMCDQEGRVGLAMTTDHILPREEFPQLAYDWGNLQGLCDHHNGVKQAMEAFARAQVPPHVDRLRIWCDSPEQRPRQFRPGDVK